MVLFKGIGDVALPVCESYDPSTGSWTETAHVLQPRGFHQASLLVNGSILITGGGTRIGLYAVNSTELLNLSQQQLWWVIRVVWLSAMQNSINDS